MSLAMRKSLLLAKLETTYGEDASPATADTLLVRNLNIRPIQGEALDRNFVRPYLGKSGIVRVTDYSMVDFEVELAGSGTAATPAAWGLLLKACGMSETIMAAALTGTAQGGTSTNIQLANAASSVDDAYNGMILSTTGGTGSGQTKLIVDYVGSTRTAVVAELFETQPDATTQYSIAANVGYLPVSDLNGDSLSLYAYVDGVRHIMLGARGTFSLSLAARQIPVIKFTFTALHGTDGNASFPTPDFSGWQKPKGVSNTNTGQLYLHAFRSGVLESLDIDIGHTVVYRQLVGDERVLITNRQSSGRIKFEATVPGTKNWWQSAANGTDGVLGIQHGTSAGHRITITAPNLYINNPNYEDQDGIAMLSADCSFFTESAGGNDEVKIVTC